MVIPAHNEEKYIKNALLSLQKQTLRPVAIIVVNDGSTDSTADVVNEFKRENEECLIHLINLERSTGYGRGIVRNLNKGKKWLDENSIQYEFLMVLDADHLLSRNYIELCMKEFELDTAIVGGKTYGIDDIRLRGGHKIHGTWLRGGHRIYAKWFIEKYPFPKVRSWDSYHYYQAIQNNYNVKIVPGAIVYESRGQGRGSWWREFTKGLDAYLLGYYFPFLIMRAIKILLIFRSMTIGILMLFGYLFACMKRMKKHPISTRNSQYQQMRIKQLLMMLLP